MSAEFFLDTSVLVHHLDASDARKHTVSERIVRLGLARGNACISYQVVQECLNVILHKAEIALDAEAAGRYLDVVLTPLMQVPASVALYHRALDVQARWRYGFHDALVIAGALAAGCSTLLSEGLRHGQRVEGLEIVDPFR